MQAAHDGDVIYGLGETEAEALFAAGCPSPRMRVAAITPALAAEVEAEGGAITWRTLRDGTLATPGEVEAEEEATAAIAAAVDLSLDLSECAPWADARRRMLTDMARALARGDPRVTLSSRGRLHWAPGAPMLHDDQPARGGRLAHGEHKAAAEMEANLDTREHVQAIEEREQRRVAQRQRNLASIGEALFGPEWVSPVSRELGVALRTVQRWAAGDVAVPARVVATELPELVVRLGPERLRVLERYARVLRAAAE